MRTDVDAAIEHSASPAEVRTALERITDAQPEVRVRLHEDRQFRDRLVAVTSASRFLTRLLVADRDAVEVLGELGTRRECDATSTADLARWKRLELLRIAGRDIAGIDDLEATGRALAALADDVLHAALRIAGAPSDGFAVIAMGKHGARELNYSSDIDVLFVGAGPARQVMDAARSCFRVDANLRPEGRNGPLARSLESYEAYWDRWAEPWEFQALLKARFAAGDAGLGDAFERAAGQRVWNGRFGAEELRSLRRMKQRSEADVARRGLTSREIKRGRGGIRDIEFAVQLLQLVHGRADPTLRVPATLSALRVLADAEYVDRSDAEALSGAYRFLRLVEHRLQLVDEEQVHALPPSADAVVRLARVLGFRDAPHATAVCQFEERLREHQATARSIHERLFFRPLLEAFTAAEPMLSPAAVEERLHALGFRDPDRTRAAVRELTAGLTRTSRLMQHLLPLLLEWLSQSPDPDLGLLGLRTLASPQHQASRLVDTFRESAEAARRLCIGLGTSRLIVDWYDRHPDEIARLAADTDLAPPGRRELAERIAFALSWRDDTDARRFGLRRVKEVEELRVAMRDVLGLADVEATGSALTGLAEAVVEVSLASVDPPVPMAVIAMGRFGGAELSFASDLDILLVFDGLDVAGAERAAERLIRFVKGDTPATRLYLLDADLRPEGKQGPLARSLDGYRSYYDRYALPWERQALLRARPIAGDADVGRAFMEIAEAFVWRRPFTAEDAREIRRVKARVERERMPAGEDPQFHLKLGRGSLSDIEWTAQLLQLQHGVRATGTISALVALEAAGLLSTDDAGVLREAYRFCERTRNRWYLVRGAPGDSLPTAPDQLAKLARSLDTTASRLRDDYRRVTRRARAVVERVFYGREG